MKNRMAKLLLIFLTGSLILAMAACGSGKTPETTPAAQQTTAAAEPAVTEAAGDATEAETDEDDSASEAVDLEISTDDQSVDLPDGYPSDILPVYPDSFVESVVSMDKGFTIIAHSKDDPEKLTAFYQDIMADGTITAESTVDQAYTVFGTLGKYTVQLTVAPEQDLDDYQTTYALMLFPA
ncbi:MAG: hypothetical protein EOM08_01215 [Clostridia bacterium]|nr:hypothetical protein [Clostridia bacterium]